MKKLFAVLLALALAIGCAAYAEEAKVSIEVLCDVVLDELDAVIYPAIEQFEAETGIEVVFSVPGSGYEELLKARMAGNDMPDVWTTHGWAVARYSEYEYALTEQPWASSVVNGIASIVTDDDGNLLVLPSAYTTFGVNYNATVLKEAGVDPEQILTWTDFEEACEKVLAIGKTPIAMGAKDSWLGAQPFQVMCPTFLTAEQTQQLADGTFNWDDIAPIIERYEQWVEKGYFNVDAVTCDYNTACEYFGKDEAAFFFCDSSPISQAKVYVPDADLGIIPVPAWEADYSERLAISGEKLSWAVWKDSENLEAAIQFVNFLSGKELTEGFAVATVCPAGLAGCEVDLGELTDDIANLGNYTCVPVWDRTLPSGMFNDMCTIGQSILAKEGEPIEEYITIFRESYEDKMA